MSFSVTPTEGLLRAVEVDGDRVVAVVEVELGEVADLPGRLDRLGEPVGVAVGVLDVRAGGVLVDDLRLRGAERAVVKVELDVVDSTEVVDDARVPGGGGVVDVEPGVLEVA